MLGRVNLSILKVAQNRKDNLREGTRIFLWGHHKQRRRSIGPRSGHRLDVGVVGVSDEGDV